MTSHKPKWTKRKARVEHSCIGFDRAKACGCVIEKGEYFYQCNWRNGLAHAEICDACAVMNGVVKNQSPVVERG